MSKKCIKCGHLLPENASFCPHCTAVQMEKKEVKTPRRWKKKTLMVLGILAVVAAVGTLISLHHRPQTYEGSAQIVYPDKDKSYKVLLTFSEGDGTCTGRTYRYFVRRHGQCTSLSAVCVRSGDRRAGMGGVFRRGGILCG